MKIFSSLTCVLLVACVSAPPARGENALYINLSPDMRYSVNGYDSRIAFDEEKALYSYGHDFGKLVPCSGSSEKCITFDFMALRALPDNAAAGAEYIEGDRRFKVERVVELSLLGSKRNAFRVDVAKDGKHSNSYLIDLQLGVVAIIIPNFGNKEIPESIFFLKGATGLFARTPSRTENTGTSF